MKPLHTMRNASTPMQQVKFAALLFCLTVGLMSRASAQETKTSAPQALDSIAVVVNNEVITRAELANRIRMTEQRMKSHNQAMPAMADFQRQILESMILEKVQLQKAKEGGIVVDDIMLDHAMAGIAEQNKMSLQDLRNQVEREGTPFNVFREEIREEIAMQRLRQSAIDNRTPITEAEIDNFLAAQSGTGSSEQEVNLGQILIHIPENSSPEQIAARKARAEEALQQLKAGTDFKKVAATYSDASDALTTGGETGWRNRDRLPELFNGAIAKLKPGEMSAVFKSANGFHILKLIDQRVAGQAATPAAAVQQTHTRHILIKVNQVVTSYEAQRKLKELKDRLDHKAETFEELAKKFSNDSSSSKGGDLGWLYPGDTVPEFERAMDALKPGQISEPVETPFGFHLIEVLERKSDDVSKERKRMAARQAIRARKDEEGTEDWLRQLRDRAYVEFRSEEK